MGRSAGSIVINLSAGSAAFVADLDRVKGKVVNFGKDVQGVSGNLKELGTHGVSQIQAVSAALRLSEGGLTNNLRASERFIANILGLGPALQAIFPAVGALAFTGLIVKMGTELYNFFKKAEEGPQKTAAAFRTMNASLALSNEELLLSNARLEQDIAKLEGIPKNNLKIALLEAKVAADQLAESLNHDIENLHKIMEENKVPWWQLLTPGTSEADKRARKLQENLAADAGSPAIQKQDIQYELGNVQKELLEVQLKKSREVGRVDFGPEIARLKQYVSVYQTEIDRIDDKLENSKLLGKKGSLEDQKSNAHALETSLKAAYDRMLTDRESFETMTSDDRLKFRENELVEIKQFNQKFTELEHELNNEIGRLSQENFAEAERARDKDFKDERTFQEKMYEQKTLWIRNTLEAGKAEFKAFGSPTEDLEGKGLRDIANLPAAVRLKGTAIGTALDVHNAGVKTAQDQRVEIEQQQELLADLQKMNAPLGEQLSLREKILQLQIAQGEQEGKNVSGLIIALGQVENEVRLRKEASDGWANFFVQMQREAKTTAQIMQDAIVSGIDRVSANLASQLTGGKGNWGKTFQDVGQQLLQETIKSQLQKSIAALGARFGLGVKRDGQTPQNAIWVQPVGSGGVIPSANSPHGGPLGGVLQGAGAIKSIWRGIFGGSSSGAGGGGGGGGSAADNVPIFSGSQGGMVFNFGGALAGGGQVSPDSGYWVGDGGEPEWFQPGASGSVTPLSKMASGNTTIVNNIDARGADLGAENRIRRGMEITHQSAVATSVQAQADLARRTPR